MKHLFTFLIITLFSAEMVRAQSKTDLAPLFTPPLGYMVNYSNEPLKIDGRLNEKAWQQAAWTADFVDIEGDSKPKPAFSTKVKMLWNYDYLFIAAQMEEPQVWALQQHHDDVIFRDNDLEVFINPDNTTHRYFEIEFNALNKVFDLFMTKPYRNGGDALIGWNVDGLKSSVHVNGTINNPADKDKGWTLEMAIPLKSLWIGYPFKGPHNGSLWRINFSRVEWDTEVINGKIVKKKDAAGNNLPEHNWVWQPIGVVNMHYPERWGYLQFTHDAAAKFVLPEAEKQKNALWEIYYRQKQYLAKNGHYALNLAELMPGAPDGSAKMEATNSQFKVTIAGISINDEGLIQYPKKP